MQQFKPLNLNLKLKLKVFIPLTLNRNPKQEPVKRVKIIYQRRNYVGLIEIFTFVYPD
jgi:hypothetical protein